MYKLLLSVIFLLPITCPIYALHTNGDVIIRERENTIEIRNELVGIVIPANSGSLNRDRYPAPIQSFIYTDNVYSDSTNNFLETPTSPYSMKIVWIKRTSKEVTVRVEYNFEKKEFLYGKKKYKGGEAGPGYYLFQATVKKGEKTIIIEEHSNYDIAYNVDITNGLYPDMARYRGWSAQSVEYGYEPSGSVYRSELDRGYPLDAAVNLNYSKAFVYPRLVLWEPAGGEQNSGRYWQIFNSKANKTANLLGFFQGRPERLIGGGSAASVQLQVTPNDGTKKASIKVSIERRGPDDSWFPRKRFQWVVFISTKSDLLSPEQQQPIANELNRISGLGSVIRSYATKPTKLLPSFYKAAIYMTEDDIATLQKRTREDAAFYKKLCDIDLGYKAIWDAWRYPDSAASLKKMLLNIEQELVLQYTKGEGTYFQQYRYWKGSNAFKYYALATSCLFASKQITLSAEEKNRLERLIGLMARIVWDDNNVPDFDSAGVNMGPGNMSFMYRNNGRTFFALLLSKDPEFAERAKDIERRINNDIDNAIYSNGSAFGTPHYIQPTVEPILFSMLQLKQSGAVDLFKTNRKIMAFARFYIALLTPPSVRFMNNRKLISFGDGSEESAVAFALLANGLKEVSPQLSKELLSCFHYGSPRGTIFGSIGLAVNLDDTPVKLYTATSANYVGYLSHFRSAVNTDNETGLWVLNGNGLYDHRNDDAGEIAIYALKAPLSLSRSSFYYPSATDSRIRSVVVPEDMFPEWNRENQPIAERSLTNRVWQLSNVTSFANLGITTSATVQMEMKNKKKWNRQISMIRLYDDLPIIVFYDSVTGNDKNIWSMMMMSDSAIQTPAGPITPVKRIHNNKELKQLPKATPQNFLSAGLNKFQFNGQYWPAHSYGGINWHLYTSSSVRTSFSLASWGTTWQNMAEVNEFNKTNQRNYSEEQQIIRLQSEKPFFNILLPYAKGNDPYEKNVRSIGSDMIEIMQKGLKVIVTPKFCFVHKKTGLFATLFSASGEMAYEGVNISGGQTEVMCIEDSIFIRLHGNTGKRKIVLPFSVKQVKAIPDITLENKGGNATIFINYKAEKLDLPSGLNGFTEFKFLKRKNQ